MPPWWARRFGAGRTESEGDFSIFFSKALRKTFFFFFSLPFGSSGFVGLILDLYSGFQDVYQSSTLSPALLFAFAFEQISFLLAGLLFSTLGA